jgi:hypothetical protein
MICETENTNNIIRLGIINFRKSLKISNGKSESVNRQTTQWLKENEQKDKQRSTKHYTEN